MHCLVTQNASRLYGSGTESTIPPNITKEQEPPNRFWSGNTKDRIATIPKLLTWQGGKQKKERKRKERLKEEGGNNLLIEGILAKYIPCLGSAQCTSYFLSRPNGYCRGHSNTFRCSGQSGLNAISLWVTSFQPSADSKE